MNPTTVTSDPTTARILVVEDERRIASLLERVLAKAGYRVDLAGDGATALKLIVEPLPDLILLDVMIPEIDGIEVARRLRSRGMAVPILMLTARDTVGDRVEGLDAGADDYVVKPFAQEELLARVRALLRRREVDAAERRRGLLIYADLSLDQDTHEVTRSGRRLELRHKEFELLAYLMRHPQIVLSRREIFEEVWGYDFLGDSNVIEVTMGHLRQKIEAGGASRLVHTVRSAGYILRDPLPPGRGPANKFPPPLGGAPPKSPLPLGEG